MRSSFGFIKYHNFEDAENCIRGFHYLGYEVSFARVCHYATAPLSPPDADPFQESFYSKLKKFSDECNTNLYVSNIPKNFNEHVCTVYPSLRSLANNLRRSLLRSSSHTKSAQAAYSATPLALAVVLVSLGT